MWGGRHGAMPSPQPCQPSSWQQVPRLCLPRRSIQRSCGGVPADPSRPTGAICGSPVVSSKPSTAAAKQMEHSGGYFSLCPVEVMSLLCKPLPSSRSTELSQSVRRLQTMLGPPHDLPKITQQADGRAHFLICDHGLFYFNHECHFYLFTNKQEPSDPLPVLMSTSLTPVPGKRIPC